MDEERRRVIRWDPHETESEDDVEFRLTYAGPLLASNVGQRDTRAARVAYKHRLRRFFHKQLEALWHVHPTLRVRHGTGDDAAARNQLADQFVENGFRYCPLVNRLWGLICGLEVQMLRSGDLGYRSASADIDNRMKTLLDVLRKPDNGAELGGAAQQAGEDPFNVLLQTDALVTRLTVDTDTMLEPVRPEEWRDVAVSAEDAKALGPDLYGEENMVRLTIKVTVRPYFSSIDNIDFTGA